MPTYGYLCPVCSKEFEHTCMMSQHTAARICACGATAYQTFDEVPAVCGINGSRDWSAENGGRGKWNGQIMDYATSPTDLVEKGKRKNLEKA